MFELCKDCLTLYTVNEVIINILSTEIHAV